MATLILSTAGTILGGPVGGAIGSLLGQAIDQQLFGAGPRNGPRLGDLAVQSSTYGSAIPRIYGSMRVAGSVVWATELEEASETQGGYKGQPEIRTFSYSANFAVALSSRTAAAIGRIWADGKLLRGAAGDFKVRTEFRFYPGSEDQPVDPLIGSAEGAGTTPAYRGLALAVFEGLELADFGNRIPFLTFEVVADPAPPSLAAVLGDASNGVIAASAARTIDGYAAHGRSIRAALQPLVEQFGLHLVDNGETLVTPGGAVREIAELDLGCSADARPAPRMERSQVPGRSLPATLTMTYYDPARDYQAGSMVAAAGKGGGPAEQVDFPAVLGADEAKALVESSLARRWAERDRLTLRLPPAMLELEPGAPLQLPGGTVWNVEKLTVEALAVVVELRPEWSAAAALPASPGRALPDADIIVGPTSLALLDLPDLGINRAAAPVLQLAAANGSARWRAVLLEIDAGGTLNSGQSAYRETVLGSAATVLGDGQAALLDLAASVEIELVDGDHWLESCDEASLVQGVNLAALGSELIQFGEAVPLGARRFRLSRLLRGRRGSEWAMGGHVVGEPFALLDANRLRAIALSPAQLGTSVTVTALGIGDGAGTSVGGIAGGEALRPPSPVHLEALLSGGDLQANWVRRSRDGWTWADAMDAPLGESAERYRARVDGTGGSAEIEVSSPAATFTAAQLATASSGPATLSVRQVGDLALSRPATLAITIP